MLRLCVAFFVLAIAVGLLGCRQSKTPPPVAETANSLPRVTVETPSDLAASLMAIDFSEALSTAEDNKSLGEFPVPFTSTESNVPSGKRTRAENMLLHGWRIPGKMADDSAPLGGDLGSLYLAVSAFYKETGRVPHDAAELIYWQYASNESGGIASPLDLTADELFLQYAYLINPVSGHFYDSFDVDSWAPGRVFLAKFSSQDELRTHFRDDRHAQACTTIEGFREAWLLRVYREVEPTLLAEKPLPVVVRDSQALGAE